MLLRITFSNRKNALENHSQECKSADENQFCLCGVMAWALLRQQGPLAIPAQCCGGKAMDMRWQA